MTNKEILQASLLDIIFENRNKEYGAYALRNDYDKRLIKALGIGLSIALLFILLNFLKFSSSSSSQFKNDKEGITLTKVEMQPDKPKEPELPRPVERPQVAQVDYRTPVIVPNDQVKQTMPDQSDMTNAAISDKNVDGVPDDKPRTSELSNTGDEQGEETKTQQPENTIKIFERAPQYPGGFEALSEFMRKNLVTPEEIEIGVKKTVRVRFIVGVDGSIADITILESPGKIYDKEVTRVLRKMPHWEPAIQNDIKVETSYVLPVTFVSEEE